MTLLAALLAALLGLALAVLAVPVLVLTVQVAAACWPRRGADTGGANSARPAVAVLVPAHDERLGIAATVRSIRAQLRPGDRLLVVADNCSDDSAALACAEGAEVVERTHATDRGKGYALQFGLDHLRAAPPAVLVVVDADCDLAAGSLDRLAAACAQHGSPVQALDLMVCGAERGLGRRVAEFAWRVKNWVRPRGAARLGLPCPLMGTGMAFPWPLIAGARLANGNLVEDMLLGIELARAGQPPRFCEAARVTSRFPDSARAGAAQRTRWEHGHLGLIGQQVPALMAAAWRARDGRLAAMALDLAVPPLALLALLMAGSWALGLLLAVLGGPVWPVLAASVLLTLLVAAVLAAWAGWGRGLLSARDLFGLPVYAAGKLGLYLRFWSARRQKDWVRTDRE
jgi:cellulose synthase/poly-beta-1,6-N-acetylglucosamine synthase-like glycosyltransferase